MIRSIIFGILAISIAILILYLFAWGTHLNQELLATQDELAITVENLKLESRKSSELGVELNKTTKELTSANATISDLKTIEYELVYIGDFKITYYCDERRAHICGGNGITASGKPTEVGWTVAADWSVLPNGSLIYIDGGGFREVQDVGGAVKERHIDVLVQEHSEALDFGVEHEDVWLLVKKGT